MEGYVETFLFRWKEIAPTKASSSKGKGKQEDPTLDNEDFELLKDLSNKSLFPMIIFFSSVFPSWKLISYFEGGGGFSSLQGKNVYSHIGGSRFGRESSPFTTDRRFSSKLAKYATASFFQLRKKYSKERN